MTPDGAFGLLRGFRFLRFMTGLLFRLGFCLFRSLLNGLGFRLLNRFLRGLRFGLFCGLFCGLFRELLRLLDLGLLSLSLCLGLLRLLLRR